MKRRSRTNQIATGLRIVRAVGAASDVLSWLSSLYLTCVKSPCPSTMSAATFDVGSAFQIFTRLLPVSATKSWFPLEPTLYGAASRSAAVPADCDVASGCPSTKSAGWKEVVGNVFQTR